MLNICFKEEILLWMQIQPTMMCKILVLSIWQFDEIIKVIPHIYIQIPFLNSPLCLNAMRCLHKLCRGHYASHILINIWSRLNMEKNPMRQSKFTKFCDINTVPRCPNLGNGLPLASSALTSSPHTPRSILTGRQDKGDKKEKGREEENG